MRERTSCHWRGKNRGSGRRSNRRSRIIRPMSYILATSPTASMRARCKVSQQLGAIKKRVSFSRNRKMIAEDFSAVLGHWANKTVHRCVGLQQQAGRDLVL